MALRNRFGATVLAALLSSTAAQADLTAQQVWDNWKAMGVASGQTVTTTGEQMAGDTLTVSGIEMSQTFPDGSAKSSIAELKFRELGDGRVEVTMAPDYTVQISTMSPEGQPTEIGLAISQSGMVMTASGDPGNANYEYKADSLSVATASVTQAGAPLPVTFALTGNAISGSYGLKQVSADVIDLNTTATFGDAAFTFSFSDPAAGSDVSAQGAITGLTLSTAGVFGQGVMREELIDALRAGFKISFGLTYGPTTFAFNATDAMGPSSGSGKNDGGGMAFTMDAAHFAYKGGAKGVEIALSSPQIPFPEVKLAYGETVFDINVPVAAAPDPQDFSFVAKLIDLTVSDEIWSMLDPAATIPRDPATVVLDAKAKARLDVDLMDEAAVAASPNGTPGELQSLDLPALQLKVGGADLTGHGALTFDNTDLVTFGGMPAPTGVIELQVVGANKLLDSLIALGIVSEEDAMGARMMMGMFARPGDGPDTLLSTIEFKDKGLYANGMQIQ